MTKAIASTRFACWIIGMLVGFTSAWCGSVESASSSAARHFQEPPLLVPGQTIEREWDDSQPHLYPLRLQAGQYVNLCLHLLAGKFYFSVTLLTPDGKRIEGTGQNNEDKQNNPSLLAVASLTGDYTVEVRADATAGTHVNPRDLSARSRYSIILAELHTATEQDSRRVEAWRAYRQAQRAYSAKDIDSLRQAKEFYLKALPLFHQLGDAVKEVDVLYMLVDLHNSFGEAEQGVEVAKQAVALARAIANPDRVANTLMYLGEAYLRLSDYQQALEAFQQALPVWQSLGKSSSWGVGWTFSSLASCYQRLGERHNAVKYGKEALKIYQAIDYNPREHYRGTGSTATNLGANYLALGEIQQALDSLSLGLENWQRAKEPWGEGRAYYYLGDLYFSLGELQPALENYQQALAKWRISEDPNMIANALQGLGKVSLKTGDYSAALRYLSEALELRIKSKERYGQVETLALLGRLYAATGEMQKTLECQRQTLALCREIGARGSEASALTDLGETHNTLGDKRQARELLQQALQFQRAVSAPAGEAQTLYLLARVNRGLGLAAEARREIEAALGIIESLRASMVGQDLRASYLASVRDYYDFYLDLLLQPSRSDEDTRLALHVSERAQARSLLESLSEIRADIKQGVDTALLMRERELQQLLNGKSEYQVRLLSGKHIIEQAAALASEIKTIVSQLQETRARIRAASPRYAALTQPQPLTAAEIQRELLDENTLLLEYALGEQRSHLFAVTTTSVTSYELPKRAEIEAQATRVYELLAARNQIIKGETPKQEQERVARANAELPQQAAALSRMMLGPIAAQLGHKRLLVVAQGKLQFIPFGALPEPESASANSPQSAVPLLAKHEIVHLPSASTLAALRRELSGRSLASKTIALLADPVFAADDERVKAARLRTNIPPHQSTANQPARDLRRALEVFGEDGEQLSFRRLKATGWEATQIAKLAPTPQVFKATGFTANRALATSGALSQYRIIHFASHGFLHSAHPELSGIVLSLIDERGQTQDGFLRLHEIYNLKLPAELVVLSACRTGLGKEIKGEGLMSLTRGFMYAGAPRVIVSAWSVEDRASATLMVKFYKHLLGPKPLSAAAALRAAQLEMWRDRQFAAPYFWAGFVLQGEWK